MESSKANENPGVHDLGKKTKKYNGGKTGGRFSSFSKKKLDTSGVRPAGPTNRIQLLKAGSPGGGEPRGDRTFESFRYHNGLAG